MSDIVRATRAYEAWLARFLEPVAGDLAKKHEAMGEDRFTHLRATFYRWAQRWQALPAKMRDAPAVYAVGDAHVENFGTWRDREGRLVWGVNDFDEAATLPYTNDLVRLVASAELAREAGLVRSKPSDIAASVLVAYDASLRAGGAPFVIENRNAWLRRLFESGARSPRRFWDKLVEVDRYTGTIPKRAAKMLREVPVDAKPIRIVHRTSGAGSLGRPRFATIYEWRGGYLAREAKARAPCAWTWATRSDDASTSLPRIWRGAIRCPDPFLAANRRWIARRLAPDCVRIDLADLPRRREELALFRAMGWELANIHLGSRGIGAVRQHVRTLDAHGLLDASEAMLSSVAADFERWRRG